MKKFYSVMAGGILLACGFAFAHDSSEPMWEREALLGDVVGLRDYLGDNGVDLVLGTTIIYQANTRNGLSTNNHKGRFSGSYDIELNIDAEKLFGIKDGSFYILAEGSWTDSEGIDGTSVGSYFGVNGDAAGNRSMDVTELWYQHNLFDSQFILRAGKLDLTGGFECKGCPVTFDGSIYANDETSQFLNSALINNPTIPFPDRGLGAVGFYNPVEWWYLSAGITDAQADGRETGFKTTFHDEDYYFSIAETGIVTDLESANGLMPGAYRAGLWYDPQPKSHSDADRLYRDDNGMYLTFDQMLFKENTVQDDTQGMGTFFRYGYAPSRANDLSQFISAGVQYQGLFDGRDDDIIGLGFARGYLSDRSDISYTDDAETVCELYYNAALAKAINLTPSIQYIANPGAKDGGSDATVVGMRLQMLF